MEKENMKIKRIGIDARFYGPAGKGLGRYTQEIVDGAIKNDYENEYVIFLKKENFDLLKTSNPKVKKIMTNVRWYGFAEQILMPLYIWKEKIDLMHFPHFNVPAFCPVRFVVTIHDLILVHYPTTRASTLGPFKYFLKNWAYRLIIWIAVKRSQKIIAVSEFTKKDIIKVFDVRPEKIDVTYEGVSEKINNLNSENIDDKKVLLGYNIHKPYVLYVGNVYPHKNMEGLFKVLSSIKDKIAGRQLILVGKDDYFYARLKMMAGEMGLWTEKGKDNLVEFVGYVPDKDLGSFYKSATAYIFPSFYEGFGLPPLEAMSHGLPVTSSNRGSLPEILGDAALFFDPSDNKSMGDKIVEIINNQGLRNDLIAKGYDNVAKFSWNRCVNKTLNIYKSILNL